MILKSFGCSFVFGSDLTDSTSGASTRQFSKLTWPALLAKQLKLGYQCCARPGSGNLQIAERVLNECQTSASDFFIISWTYIDRFDYSISTNSWQSWNTLMPGQSHALAKTYYQNLHSEYRDKLSTLIYIKTVIDTLKQLNIKFVMTYIDELMFDHHWHVTPAITVLQNYIRPYMTTFEGQTFLEWSRNHGYPESTIGHPLEQAHQAAADIMFNSFDTQKINDLAQ
jgi:hypothetical protein